MLIESVVEIIVSIVMLVVAILLGGWFAALAGLFAGIYFIGSLGSIGCYFLFKDDQC